MLLTGSGTWTVPNGVTSISVLGIEQGLAGSQGDTFVIGVGGSGGIGGLGGRRRYINNVAVSPGDVISYSVSAGSFSFGSILTGSSGGEDAGRAGQGGRGAGASTSQTVPGSGGAAGAPLSYIDSDIDYVFLPATTAPGVAAAKGLYPGGGGGGGSSGVNIQGGQVGGPGAQGGEGVISVLWPGSSRTFPRSRTLKEIPGEVGYDPRSLPSYLCKFATDGAGTWFAIDTSADVGRRGRIFRSTDNGRTYQYLATPVDARLAGIAYGSGALVITLFAIVATNTAAVLRSVNLGESFSQINIAQANGGDQWDLSFRAGRFLSVNSRSSATGNRYMQSDDGGQTWTNGGTGSFTVVSGSFQQARYIRFTDTALILRHGNESQSKISRNSGLTFTDTDITDAAKLGSVTLGLADGASFPNQIVTSSDDLANYTAVPGITLTADRRQRCLIPLNDRILILDGAVTYQFKDGSFSVVPRLPIDIPYSLGTAASSENPGFHLATDGIDCIFSALKMNGAANFRSSVYVS